MKITARVFGLILVASAPAAMPSSATAQQAAEPGFFSHERLVYDISWSGFKVGQGVLESVPGSRPDGRGVLHVRSTAVSNKLLSFFYPVKDRIESVMDLEGLYSYQIIVDQRHGLRERRKEVYFDQNEHTAVMTFKGKTTRYDIPPQVNDMLSSLYYFRALPNLQTGESVFIDVHESKKNWKLEIQVLGREPLKTVLGTIRTVKVKAIVLFEGVLWDKGDLYLWLTDDSRRIPVVMNGKITIGSVTAMLTRVEPQRIAPSP